MEQDFFDSEKHKYNRKLLVSISTIRWTPLAHTHTCINMTLTYFCHSWVSLVVTQCSQLHLLGIWNPVPSHCFIPLSRRIYIYIYIYAFPGAISTWMYQDNCLAKGKTTWKDQLHLLSLESVQGHCISVGKTTRRSVKEPQNQMKTCQKGKTTQKNIGPWKENPPYNEELFSSYCPEYQPLET